MTEWVHITPGVVTVEGRSQSVEAFEIGRCPVTSEEFERFVAAGGYSERAWWTGPGWQWREDGDIRSPQFWHEPFWHRPRHPVVGVHWHEAAAYCEWLSVALGAPIALPTELQRERSARGDEGLPYPWGQFFDVNRCNSAESGIGRTTPVDQYENGKSPFGVLDMSGNVWEWCQDVWDPMLPVDSPVATSDDRVLRGGSYYDVALTTLCEIRARYKSLVRLPYVGFRVVVNANK